MPRRALVGLVLLGVVVAACSAPDPAAVEQASDDDRIQVELWYQPNGMHPERLMAEELQRFEAEHPGIEVVPTMVGWDESLTKLATATRSGVGPDVTFLGSSWVADMVSDGAFHVFTDEELARVGGADRFHDSAWATGIDTDGEVVAIPWVVETRLLFYRSDLLAEAGVDPETDLHDWASFERSLQMLEEHSEVSAWALPGRNDWNVVHNALSWVWASGGGPVGELATPSLASPEAVASLSELQRLVGRYGAPEALVRDTSHAQDGFASGEYAMTISGPWLATTLANRLPDGAWGVAPLPAGPGQRATLTGGSHIAILEESEEIEAAVDLVAFFSQPDSQTRLAEQTRMLPGRRDAELTGPEADATRAALAAASPSSQPGGWLSIEAALQRSLIRMWTQVEQGTPLSDEDLMALLEAVDAEVADALDRTTS